MAPWMLISDSIISVHQQLYQGVTLRYVSNWFSRKHCTGTYIDDIDTYADYDGPETVKEYGNKDPFEDEEDPSETIIQTL